MAAPAQMSDYREPRGKRREQHDVEEYLRRLADLRSRRATWDSHWQEIAQRIWPAGDEFYGRAYSNWTTGGGEKRTQQIYDATGALALERFAAIMESLNTPRSKIWANVRSDDDELNKEPTAKAWYEKVTRVLSDERSRARANYYSQMHEGYMSMGAFGGHPLFVDEQKGGGLRYRYIHVNELYVETDFTGMVDTVYRVYQMSARQATQQWGEGAGEKVRNAMRANRPDERFEFCHVVKPRKDVDPDSFGPDSKPFLSLYIAVDEKKILEEGGYQTMRYLYSRWTVAPSEVYGRSPAMMALPHIKTANEMQKTFLAAGHRAVIPPLLVPHEGVFGGGATRIRNVPGGLNYGGVNDRGEPMIKPLVSGMDVGLTEAMLETERQIIKDWFLVSLFRTLLDDPRSQTTATEILQRAQEKGDIIAPSVGRLQSELLGPQIECEFQLLWEQGRIPPPPDVVLEAGKFGVGWKIEYVSEATRLQKSRETLGIRSVVELTAALAPLDPRAAAKIKLDEAIGAIAEYEGVPSEIVRSEEEVDAIVQAQQQQQEQAAQLAMFQAGASGAKDATAAIAQAQGAAQGGAPAAA